MTFPAPLQNPEFRFVKIRVKEKGPFEQKWQDTANYPFDSNELLAWISCGNNYGVVCGRGHLAVIDCDRDDVSQAVLSELPETFSVQTGSGKWHYYYFVPDLDAPIRLFDDTKKNIGDVRFTGQQVVGPGSIHPCGNYYRVHNGRDIATIRAEQLRCALRQFIPDSDKTEPYEPKSPEDSLEIPLKITDVIPLENLKFFPARGEYQGAHPIHGSEGGSNFTVNPDKNIWHCFRCGTGGGPLQWIAVKNGLLTCAECKKGALKGEKFIKALEFAGLTDIIEKITKPQAVLQKDGIIEDADPSIFFEGKHKEKFISKLLGDYILKRISIKTTIGNDEMFYYKDGIYRKNGKQFVKEVIAYLLKDAFNVHCLNETLGYIQAVTYIDPDLVNTTWINLENGLLDPLTMEFKPHTPDIFSIVRIPINYDPAAVCPIWTATMKEKTTPEVYATVQEMFGYCFVPGQKYEKAFLLIGQKRTFKSTCLYGLQKLQGKENLSGFTLQRLSEDIFSAAYLYGKTLNVCADISAKSLTDTGMFLTITGGDPITVGKKHQDPFTFYPSAKLVFSCNVVPATTNKHPAFYRRWCPLRFDVQTPLEKVDHNFRAKIDGELPGILNWALEGLKRLEANGKFSLNLSEEDIKDMYEKSSDTTQSFIYNEIDTEDDEGALTKRETYAGYLNYCKKNELQSINPVAFGRLFIALTGCGIGKKGKHDAALPAYKGVNWKDRVNGAPLGALAKFETGRKSETAEEDADDDGFF